MQHTVTQLWDFPLILPVIAVLVDLQAHRAWPGFKPAEGCLFMNQPAISWTGECSTRRLAGPCCEGGLTMQINT